MYEFVAAALLPLAALLPAQDKAKPQKPTTKPSKTAAQPAGKGAKPEVGRRMSARHILIPWKGSAGATRTTTMTKVDAKKKADEVVKLLSTGGDFSKLALAHSSCRSKVDGGYLGQFDPQAISAKALVAALDKVKAGEVAGPVETQFGWHVVQRLAIKQLWPKTVSLSHVLISHKDSLQPLPGVTRSKEEAKALAAKIYAEIKTGKRSFADAVKAHSDDPRTKPKGGKFGEVPSTSFIATLVDAVLALKVGQIAAPIETQFGFHIMRRDKILGPMRASHILIPWNGARNAPPGTKLTKEEALAKAKELLAKVSKSGEDFAALAKAHSTCPSKDRGGDLGVFLEGRMVKPFEQAVIASKVGDVSGPVETVFGWHIILRTK